MKKILIIVALFIINNHILAIENIKIDDNDLIPSFDKKISTYNYYTNNNEVNLIIKKEKSESVNTEGVIPLNKMFNTIKIESSKGSIYTINIIKNYDKDYKNEPYLEDLSIEGYKIDFDREKYEYVIVLHDEENLVINYEPSNYDDNVKIIGNGNFNKSDNLIKIIINDKIEYKIHALKTLKVSSVQKEEFKEISSTKKEIVKLIIITISCIIVFGFFYLLFIYHRT